MKRLRLILLALAVLGGGACGDSGPSGPYTGPVKVLTWNLYLGADLVPLATVTKLEDLPGVTAEMWAKVEATDFPARAKIIARKINELVPDLVGLQEVTLYRKQTPSDFVPGAAPNAIDVELDFLKLVMDELTALGARYQVAIEAPNADVELPVSDGAGGVFDLRVTDRDVILARVDTSDAQQQPFKAKLNFSVGGAGGAPLAFTRSASHVTTSFLPGLPFTFATSHLEIGGLTAIQTAQANELLGFMNAIPGPIVLIGDFNSAPGGASYKLLTKSFRDLAAKLPAPATDPTCCQGDDLTNATSSAGERIDLVLTRGDFRMISLTPIGTDPTMDRTPSGRWASDHFGVYAELELR